MIIKNRFWTIYIITILLLASSCSRQAFTPQYSIEKEQELTTSHSDIVFNYKLDRQAIRDTFNRSIDEALAEASGNLEYGIKIDIKKLDEADVIFDQKLVMVSVPVRVNLIRRTFFHDFIAAGTLEMVFISHLNVDTLWNLKINTAIAHYRWLTRPRLDAGFMIPIEKISNWILDKYKTEIEENIDRTVQEYISLRNRMTKNMKIFGKPIPVSGSVGGWLQIIPEIAYISGSKRTYDWTLGKIYFRARNSYSSYKPAESHTKYLPPVFIEDNLSDTSVIRLLTELTMENLSKQVNRNFAGRSFYDGDKYITIQNVFISIYQNKISAILKVTGSFNGTIFISGTPVYDFLNNKVYAKNIDISLKTKNVFHKAVSWLGKGKMKATLETTLVFSLEDSITYLQQVINDQVNSIQDEYGLKVDAHIGSVQIEEMKLASEGISVLFNFKTYIEITVNDFRSFNNMSW